MSRRIDESGHSEAGIRHQIETVKGKIQVGKEKKKQAINCIFAGMLPKNKEQFYFLSTVKLKRLCVIIGIGKKMRFCGSAKIIDEIKEIKTIVVNHSLRVKNYLNRKYGKGRWRKLKGQTTVELRDGTVCRVEIHWYSAHGIGNVDCKVKHFWD